MKTRVVLMNFCVPSLVILAVELGTAPLVYSQNATTTPVGVVTVEVKAKPTSSRSFNFLSLPLLRSAVFAGVIPVGGVSTSNGTTVLTFATNSFTGNLAASNAPHYVEISNGTYAGITSSIIANTNSTLTLEDNINLVLVAGTTTVAVRPHWTLGTAFPNGDGFQKGTSPANSDTVTLIDPDTGDQNSFFYSSTANEWRSGFTSANNKVIPPDAGIWIERKSPSSGFSFKLTGEVKITQSAIYIGGNSPLRRTLAPNLYPLNSVTLQNSGLYTGNATTGLAGGTAPNVADNLVISDPVTGSQTTYYYNTAANEWRTAFSSSNNVQIPANSAVLILRKSGRPPFVWYVPRPSMNLD